MTLFSRALLQQCKRKNIFSIYPQIIRWHWQGVLTKYYDREAGKYKFDEWEEVLYNWDEPGKANTSLLKRHIYSKRHIKPKLKKKMKTEAIIHTRKMIKISNLINFVKFMKDHPDDFKRDTGRPEDDSDSEEDDSDGDDDDP